MKINLPSVTGKTSVLAASLAMFFCTSCDKATEELTQPSVDGATSAQKASNLGQEYVPNELLVKFRPGTSAEAKSRALEMISGKVSEHILTKAMERHGDSEGLMLV